MEAMLFNDETNYKTSYKGHEIKPPTFTLYKKKPQLKQHQSKPLKDVHTLTDWKAKAIPFDLLLRPKPIIRTNPMKVQEKYKNIEDLDREEAQKTRPRLIMSPAVSMDDIENPRARAILCEDMYVSDTARGLKEAVFPYLSVKAPFTGHPAPCNPVSLPKIKPAYVSSEWRMETVSWDNSQLRAYCDPTRDFWMARKLRCRACDESATIQLHRQKLCQAHIGKR